MRISPIKYNFQKFNNLSNKKQEKQSAISFGTTSTTVYKTAKDGVIVRPFYDKDMKFAGFQRGQILNSNSTRFFREDIWWWGFGKQLDSLFPNNEKVNVYNFACSDGSEPYSLAISLIEDLGEEKAKRFFPIKASDADPKILRDAKSGKILASSEDIKKLKEVTKNNIEKYFEIEELTTGYVLTAKDILKNNVEFTNQTFEKGLDEVEKSNSLILCRNFWAYMGEDEIINCAKKLQKNLDETSIMLIGSFDLTLGMPPKFLTELGIGYATDLYGEECILRNEYGEDNREYEDENLIREEIKEYRKRKLERNGNSSYCV